MTLNDIHPDSKILFALYLDTEKQREHVLIGEERQVRNHLLGYYETTLIADDTRPFGTLIQECSPPIVREMAEIQVALCTSTGRRKSMLFEPAKAYLQGMLDSDNLAKQFIALRLWQEFIRTDKRNEHDLIDRVETLTLPLRFNILQDALQWQEYLSVYNHSRLDSEYFRHSASVLFKIDTHLTEYHATEWSLLPLIPYYLKHVYNERNYIHACKVCGRLFQTTTPKHNIFCSTECKKEQVRLNKQEHDERVKELSYEQAYEAGYTYWYNRLAKLRRTGADAEKVAQVEQAFKAFRAEAKRRKKSVAEGILPATDFEGWLLEQRNVVDSLMEQG
ncbi:hypothetical protein LJC34_01710 [Oscillospiraceae bacterium OttesenSCG-928-G22]|nr:hypothetical protein [Oscillospiraceae bacterium OttesenSCG-928-G22]